MSATETKSEVVEVMEFTRDRDGQNRLTATLYSNNPWYHVYPNTSGAIPAIFKLTRDEVIAEANRLGFTQV